MRSVVPVALSVVLALSAAPAASLADRAPEPADSARDTPGCVSKAEYRQTHKGVRKKRLERRVYETDGWRDWDGRPISFRYGFCKGVRPQAHAKDFAVRYRVKSGKRVVRAKYCGRTWKNRRPCF